MSGTWASGWALNDIVTVSEFAKGVGSIADSTLGVAAASFDFLSLPTTYAALLVVCYLRGDTAATSTGALVRLNNDSAANYDSLTAYMKSAGTTSSAETIAGTSAQMGQISAATGPASAFDSFAFWIPAYGQTTGHKSLTGTGTRKDAATTTNVFSYNSAGWWRSTAAVNRITILPSAGNFVAGSRVTVYATGA